MTLEVESVVMEHVADHEPQGVNWRRLPAITATIIRGPASPDIAINISGVTEVITPAQKALWLSVEDDIRATVANTARRKAMLAAALKAIPYWECPVHGKISAVTPLRVPEPRLPFGRAPRYCSQCLGDAVVAAGIVELQPPQAEEGG